MTDTSLIADFVDETREHLEELEGNLLRLESDPSDSELLNTIFRAMHTMHTVSLILLLRPKPKPKNRRLSFSSRSSAKDHQIRRERAVFTALPLAMKKLWQRKKT